MTKNDQKQLDATLWATVNQQCDAMKNTQRVVELPFRVKRVRSLDELNSVARIRQQAYGRHLPKFAQSLASPELADFETDTVVLLATAKQDNAPLATMRIHTNHNKPLPLEQAVTLPEAMCSTSLAEAVRFSVVSGRSGGGGAGT